MTVKKSTLALATALAACFVGCEWTGSDESDSWSNTYDGMNFSGTYRAVTTASNVSTTTTTTSDDTELDDDAFTSAEEKNVGTFAAGAKTAAGQATFGNLVPGSFQATAGSYIWTDNGSGGLTFGGGSSGSSATSENQPVKDEPLGTTTTGRNYSFNLAGNNVVPNSVTISIDGKEAFVDDGGGGLTARGISGSGTVNYVTGAVTINLNAPPVSGKAITASYTFVSTDGTTVSSGVSGTGAVQYSSGAWSLTIVSKEGMPSASAITIRYSYYTKNSGSTAVHTAINTSTGTEVSAITVSQNGQNLTFTLNNGIRMSGKFTNVQQTGKINEDTSSGYNTYNAQFQVQSQDTRMVGSLNYDLQTGYRMLNGTWTWGKNTYDVQARGPAWKNSVDDSTLSVDTITKAGNSNTKNTGSAYASGNQTVNVGTVQNVNPMSNR